MITVKSVQLVTYEEGVCFLNEDFDYFPYEITHLFVEDENVIGVCFLEFDEETRTIYIANLDAIIERKGYGRKMIDHLKTLKEYDFIAGYTDETAMKFWEKMNAEIGVYHKTIEGFEFTIQTK